MNCGRLSVAMEIFSGFLFVGSFLFMLSEASVVRLQACPGREYLHLGCFQPFNNTNWLPQSPEFIETTFQLFTRRNRVVGQDLDADHVQTIRNSNFNNEKKTKILVHGYMQNAHMPFLINTTRDLLDYEDMNVIVVGWANGARYIYGQSSANTRLVGAQLARLMSKMVHHAGLTLDKVHIIGHSLGAHVAGYAGERTPGLARITALDPAQPDFQGFGPEVRLDTTDALLVDVIHTDGSDYNTVGGYGMTVPVGHIDFFPNGGHNQPGCQDENSVLGVMEDALINGLTEAEGHVSCSHERSVHLFAASIQSHAPCIFRAVSCESEEAFLNGECTGCGRHDCPVMGLHADRSQIHGVFYLDTTGSAPFCGHHYFVSLTLNPNMDNTNGRVEVKLMGPSGHTEWTEINSGVMAAGHVISKMFLSQVEVGAISDVKIRFTYTGSGSMFDWGGGNQLILTKVKATNLKRIHPKFFCPSNSDMVIESGHQLNLSNGSYRDTCN